MSITFSLPTFPRSSTLLNSVKLPWGCIIKPFSLPPSGQEIGAAADVPRCESCFGYVNPVCTFRKAYWQCSLCREYNQAPERYHDIDKRRTLPELSNSVVELKLEEDPGVLAFVSIVDQNGDKDYFEAVKGSLLAALEALPDDTLIGLLTFSDQIGVFDLNNSASMPSVTHISVPEDSNESLEITIDEILPLEQFLVKKSESVKSISAAIESLSLLLEVSSGAASASSSILLPPTSGEEEKGQKSSLSEKRAFGSAVRSLIDVLSAKNLKQIYNCKALCFVNGAANWGAGAIPADDTRVTALNTRPSISFYEEQAKRACASGISFDLIVTSSAPVGLTNIRFLATLTGGQVTSYEPIRMHDALPQDTFKRLSRGMGFRGLLRLRTTAEFEPKDYHGNMLPDAEHDNLYHVTCADERSTFAFDFKWRLNEQFEEETLATLQLAYACTFFPPRSAASSKPLRLLRLVTVTQQTTTSAFELYRNADLNNITFLLTQKVIGFCDDIGTEPALTALSDFLVAVLRLHEKHQDSPHAAGAGAAVGSVPLDAKLPQNLQLLPRIVFGLEKSGLFAKEVHPDAWMQTICSWSTLEPKLLRRCVYPELFSFNAKNNFELVKQNVPLSAHAIASSGECVFLLDSCQTLCIFYTTIAVASNVIFPPPKESPVRTMLNSRKAECPLVPNTVITKEGNPDQVLFLISLIDDANSAAAISYSQFTERIQSKLAKLSRLAV